MTHFSTEQYKDLNLFFNNANMGQTINLSVLNVGHCDFLRKRETEGDGF